MQFKGLVGIDERQPSVMEKLAPLNLQPSLPQSSSQAIEQQPDLQPAQHDHAPSTHRR